MRSLCCQVKCFVVFVTLIYNFVAFITLIHYTDFVVFITQASSEKSHPLKGENWPPRI